MTDHQRKPKTVTDAVSIQLAEARKKHDRMVASAGTGDDAVIQARAKAKVAYETARARRERVRADQAEGRVIEVADAQRQINALASAVRAQLDRAPAYLPSHLNPDLRQLCEDALKQAIAQALRAAASHTKGQP